jgi:hypothetical protein
MIIHPISECTAHIRSRVARPGGLPQRRRQSRSTTGAVAPRPGARSWPRCRATPGRPGLTLSRSVDELDRSPRANVLSKYLYASCAVQGALGDSVDLCTGQELTDPSAAQERVMNR